MLRLGGALTGMSAAAWQLELHLGLLVFSGYVIFDTQVWYCWYLNTSHQHTTVQPMQPHPTIHPKTHHFTSTHPALPIQTHAYMYALMSLLPQLIVERASAGDFDTVRHALDLFVDAIAIAVRVMVILLRSQERRERAEAERRRRRDD